MNVVAIILARGGSKGVRKKNIIDFCGKPLIAWTIDNCIKGCANSVWVSSDSDEILEISAEYGANKIKRPENIQKKNKKKSGKLTTIGTMHYHHIYIQKYLQNL